MYKLKSVKLIGFITISVIATVALFLKITDFSGWANFMKWVFPFYLTANVASKFVENKKK